LAVGVSFASLLVLRSGWMRDRAWKQEQARLGTIVNNYYAPRREALSNGFAVAGGVLVSLWWAAATWSVVLGGMRRNVAGRGLADFEVAALMGAITGAFAGAVVGLIVGHWWETRHRRARLERRTANA
jgi:outer membrane lipoprotein SlyB